MFSFKEFISEAKVSQRNLNKVADIFKRIMEREFHTKMYRFGGANGFSEIKNGVGILYFYERNKAVRINYVRGEIVSLTLWNAFTNARKGDYTIDLGGLGLLQAGKKLISIIRAPRPGKIPTYGDIAEGTLTEATRIKPEDFANLVHQNLPPQFRLNAVPWGVLADIALANDYQVPTTVRKDAKVPGTKGKDAKYDLTKYLPHGDLADKSKQTPGSDKTYYIKVSAQDNETKKFHTVKGDAKAEELYKKINAALFSPTNQQIQAEMMHPDTLFGRMKNLVQVICRGTRNSLVIYGGPGTGKTFTVTQTVKEEGYTFNKDAFVVKGRISTASLYQTLFMHRKGGLLIFDDTDSLWGDTEAANILKAALDSYDERTVSWLTARTLNVSKFSPEEREKYNETIDNKLGYDEDGSGKSPKLPSEFNYNGRIIFISNLPYEKFDAAVLNRAAKIDMTLTDEQMFIRMESILEHLGSDDVPFEKKKEILEFLKQQNIKGLLEGPSMRTFVAAEDLYRSGLPNWKELLEYV